ncbi:MAG: sulfite exporter TauE/SafE family protein [Candidatus Velthaea sp.]
MLTAPQYVEIFLLGVCGSVIGSIVGLGGGFVVIPLLRLAFNIEPSVVSGTSLVFVLANVAAGSIGYLRQKRVDLSIALPLSIGGVPGSVLGVVLVHRLSAAWFDYAYGGVLLFLFLLIMRRRTQESVADGTKTIAHNWPVAIAAGVLLGLVSSLFGIGGGIVTVPLLLVAARMRPHVVSATSGFVILLTAPVGIVAHAVSHDIDWIAAVPLVAGGLTGGWIAPGIARRLSARTLVTLLGVAVLAAVCGLVLRHI